MKRTIRIILMGLALLPIAVVGQETYTYAIRPAEVSPADRHKPDTLQLDLYRPAEPRADHACVIHLHGGGFMHGHRRDSLSLLTCQRLQERGFVVISVDYRLMARNVDFDTLKWCHGIAFAETVFRSATEDCCSAVRYAVEHAEEWGIDTSRIILTGSSAGAITVLQTDYCRANGHAWASELPQGLRFAAVVSYAGAIYSNDGKPHYPTPPAPTCLFHGTKDKLVTYKSLDLFKYHFSGSSVIAKTLLDSGERCPQRVSYMFYRFVGHNHDVAEMMPRTVDEFVAFVDKALAGRFFQYETDCYNEAVDTDKVFSINLLKGI